MRLAKKYVLGAGLFAALLLMGGISAFTYRSTNQLRTIEQSVAHTHEVLQALAQYSSFVKDAETGQRGYLLTGQEDFLTPYARAVPKIEIQLNQIDKLTADNPGQQVRLGELRTLTRARLRSLLERIEQRRQGSLPAAVLAAKLGEGKTIMEQIRRQVGAMEMAEHDLLQRRSAESDTLAQRMNQLLLFGNTISLLIVISIFVMLAREINASQIKEAHISSLHDALQSQMDELEAANKELEAFSYTISHDLRAPLRAMDGFSRILQEDYKHELSEEAGEFVERVRANAQQMGMLVDDLLEFSRLSRAPIKMETVDINDIVVQTCEELQASIYGVPGHVVMLSMGDLPSTQGDTRLMKQVFFNLISNALKYSRNRPIANVEIGSRRGVPPGCYSEEIIYFVKDNGAGFDMKFAHKLFGVFNRLHRFEDYEGTGVGLAIVRRIIERHGGQIWAEAEVDKGATFFLTIGREPVAVTKTEVSL